MKNVTLGIMICSSFISSAAMAAEQRPSYIAFKAPRVAAATQSVAPATPVVAKRNKAAGGIPLYIPIVGALAVAGIVVAASGGGDNGSPG